MSFHSFIIWYMLWSELVKCHKEQWLELAGFPINCSRGKPSLLPMPTKTFLALGYSHQSI
jgi:hypothetical protein